MGISAEENETQRTVTQMKEKMKQYLFVMRELTGRELKRKYARSYLGVIWSVLNPLLTMVVMSLIFSKMFKRNIDNFPVYYLTGQILWTMFTGATNAAMTALVDNKLMMTRTKLPRQIFPLSRIFTSLVNFGYSMIAYVIIVAFFRIVPTPATLFFVVDVLLLLLFSIGLGYILSILYTFLADIKYLYGILLTVWMYLSALFFPVDNLSAGIKQVILANPIYGFIRTARSVVMEGVMPPVSVIIQITVWGLGMFGLGKLIFKLNQNKILIQNL